MKLETPKDVFLYLSKYLHCNYITINCIDEKTFFLCAILRKLNAYKKISDKLYLETSQKLSFYLQTYAVNFGAFISNKEFMFTALEIKKRKAFLKFIYEIELKHEQNNSN